MTAPNSTSHRALIFLLLVSLMTCVYMLSYRAVIQAGDTRRAFDAVTSRSRYGDWLMDESNWTKPALRIRGADQLPLGAYEVDEKLNIQLAMPLLKLADALPNLGNIHTVWFFNVFFCALNVGLVYLILRALQYGDRAAVLVSLSAGLGTNLWAYSQTFFREPLTTFFILVALLIIQIGHSRTLRQYPLFLALAAVGLRLAIETKYSALMALPAPIIFALPAIARTPEKLRRFLSSALSAALLLLLLALMLIDPLPAAVLQELERFGYSGEYIGEALRTYLLSPGASLWGTSPIVLLALAGGVMLWRRGQYRLPVFACVFCAVYAIGHAISTGPHWFGGLSWPPRFLLPVIPILMLLTAPVAELLFERGRRALRLIWLLLLTYGIWIQFSAVSLSWNHYSDSLPAESSGLSEWTPSLTEPRYFRWVVLPRRWSDLGFDFLWTRANLPVWGLSFFALGAVFSVALLQVMRRRRSRWRYAAPPLTLLCLTLILLNLSAAYKKDPRTQSHKEALHAAIDFLSIHAAADDVLLLTSNDYGDFILNHLDGAAPRPIILPRPPAQAASDRQPALLRSSNPNDWFDVGSLRALQHLAQQKRRLWVLDNTSPFMPWSFRPLERFLALNYYPLRTVNLQPSDDTVRLLEYSAISPAPNPMASYSGDIALDLRYGDHIRPRGLVLPGGLRYQAGDVLELSLLWGTEAPLLRDFTVAWFVASAETKAPVAQGQDSGPQAGFAPTSAWKPHDMIWDNRALRLPPSLPAGEYQIWVLMYEYDGATGEIRRLPVSGGETTGDDTVGILPVTLTIE